MHDFYVPTAVLFVLVSGLMLYIIGMGIHSYFLEKVFRRKLGLEPTQLNPVGMLAFFSILTPLFITAVWSLKHPNQWVVLIPLLVATTGFVAYMSQSPYSAISVFRSTSREWSAWVAKIEKERGEYG